MNLNKKITKFEGDGIPAYNAKINELIEAVNWFAGIRTINGKPISESPHGPIIDLSPVNNSQPDTGPQPWLTDPDGNQAGWTKVKVFDSTAQLFYDVYVWSGALLSQETPYWLEDPTGSPAGWIVCTQNSFWGTGECATGTGCTNYVAGTYNASNFGTGIITNPFWTTYTAPNITPPTSCTPRFYWKVPKDPNNPNYPCLYCSGDLGNYTYQFTASYDGQQFLLQNGNLAIQSSATVYIDLNPAGWTFDPSGLPGYAHGSGQWVYQFNGQVSNNPNAVVKFNLAYTSPTGGLISFTDTANQVNFMSP